MTVETEVVKYHLKPSYTHDVEKNTIQSSLILDKFISSCMQLDASILEPFLDDDVIFENKDKYKFLSSLNRNLWICRTKAEKAGLPFTVTKSNETCLGCSIGKPVLRFKVFCSEALVYEFAYVIQQNDGLVEDIYQCNVYKESQRALLASGYYVKPEGLPEIHVSL